MAKRTARREPRSRTGGRPPGRRDIAPPGQIFSPGHCHLGKFSHPAIATWANFLKTFVCLFPLSLFVKQETNRAPGARLPRKKPVSPRFPERASRNVLPGTWAALPGTCFPGPPANRGYFWLSHRVPRPENLDFFLKYSRTCTGADFTQTTGSQNKYL